jgi:putative copper resistance protein D
VALSRLVSSWLRLEGPSQLITTGYGVLLCLKAAAGARHRLRTLPGLRAGRPEAFRRLAGGELAVMAGVYGVAVALSRTPVG